MQTSMVHAVKVALVDQLSALEGLAGIDVSSADLGSDRPVNGLTLADVTDWSHTWGALGNLRKDEQFTIETFLMVVKGGAGEATIRAARLGAMEIIAEIETYLRSSSIHGDDVDGITLQGLVRRAEWQPRSMWEGAAANGRWCLIEGGITITARLTRGED